MLEIATGQNITVYRDASVKITLGHNAIKTNILLADIMQEFIFYVDIMTEFGFIATCKQ